MDRIKDKSPTSLSPRAPDGLHALLRNALPRFSDDDPRDWIDVVTEDFIDNEGEPLEQEEVEFQSAAPTQRIEMSDVHPILLAIAAESESPPSTKPRRGSGPRAHVAAWPTHGPARTGASGGRRLQASPTSAAGAMAAGDSRGYRVRFRLAIAFALVGYLTLVVVLLRDTAPQAPPTSVGPSVVAPLSAPSPLPVALSPVIAQLRETSSAEAACLGKHGAAAVSPPAPSNPSSREPSPEPSERRATSARPPLGSASAIGDTGGDPSTNVLTAEALERQVEFDFGI